MRWNRAILAPDELFAPPLVEDVRVSDLHSPHTMKPNLLCLSILALAAAVPAGSSSASDQTKHPAGLIELDRGWTNPHVQGVRVRLGWSDLQPKSATEYDWSPIDSAIASAQQNHKLLGLSVAMLGRKEGGGKNAIPAWLKAKEYSLPATRSGNKRSLILPWDPEVQPALLAFVKALCQHVDGKVDYLAMGGLGVVIESYICRDPATIGLTMDEAVAKWTASCNAIIDAHAENLHSTPFIFTAGKPFGGRAGMQALDRVVSAAAKKYPGRFGIMNCTLSARSRAEFPPNKLVKEFHDTNPVGLQFLTGTKGFGNHDLGGTLAQALDAGTALGAHYIEIYARDADDPANAATLTTYAERLKAK